MQVIGSYSFGGQSVEGYGHTTIPLRPGNYDFQVFLESIHHVNRVQKMDAHTSYDTRPFSSHNTNLK